jgi:hypothetical protein
MCKGLVINNENCVIQSTRVDPANQRPINVSKYCFIKKVKWTVVHALRLCTGRTAHRGSRGIALIFHDHGTKRGEGSASRPGHSLPPRKNRYPLYRRLGGPQGRSGQVQQISPPLGFDSRAVQSVASRYTEFPTLPTLFYLTIQM